MTSALLVLVLLAFPPADKRGPWPERPVPAVVEVSNGL